MRLSKERSVERATRPRRPNEDGNEESAGDVKASSFGPGAWLASMCVASWELDLAPEVLARVCQGLNVSVETQRDTTVRRKVQARCDAVRRAVVHVMENTMKKDWLRMPNKVVNVRRAWRSSVKAWDALHQQQRAANPQLELLSASEVLGDEHGGAEIIIGLCDWVLGAVLSSSPM